eukprot:8834245-Pyramimonas_sp.AAC.1
MPRISNMYLRAPTLRTVGYIRPSHLADGLSSKAVVETATAAAPHTIARLHHIVELLMSPECAFLLRPRPTRCMCMTSNVLRCATLWSCSSVTMLTCLRNCDTPTGNVYQYMHSACQSKTRWYRVSVDSVPGYAWQPYSA